MIFNGLSFNSSDFKKMFKKKDKNKGMLKISSPSKQKQLDLGG